MKNYRKKILLSIFIIVILFFSFFGKVILSQIAFAYADSICKKKFGMELKYENFLISFNEIYLNDVTLKSLNPENPSKFFAKEIKINYDFKWLLRTINVDIEIIHSNFLFLESEKMMNQIKNYNSRNSLFKISPTIRMKEGSISFYDPKKNMISYDFELEWNLKDYDKVYILLKDVLQKNKIVEITYNQLKTNEFFFNAYFNQAKLENINSFLNLFKIKSNDWIITEGIANGFISLNHEKGKEFTATGKLSLNDLSIENMVNQLKIGFESIEIDLSRKTLKGKPIHGQAQVHGENFIKFPLKNESEWAFKNLNGTFVFQKNNQIDFICSTQTKSKLEDFTINLFGGLKFNKNLEVTADLQMQTNHLNGHSSKFKIGIDHLGSPLSCTEFQLIKIDFNEIEFFKNALNKLICHQGYPTFKKGILEGRGKIYLKRFEIENIEISNFSIENFLIKNEAWNLCCSANKFTGKLGTNFDSNKFFDGFELQGLIENGLIEIEGNHNELLKFSNIETNVNIKKGIFEKSIIKGNFAGLLGNIEIDWESKSEICKFCLEGNISKLEPFFANTIKYRIDEQLLNDKLNFISTISKEEKGIIIHSLMKISNEKGKNEEISFGFKLIEKDSLNTLINWKQFPGATFSWLLNQLNIQTEYLLLNKYNNKLVLTDGWLHAQELPLDRYLSPFFMNDRETKLKGIINVYGTFDQKGLGITYKIENGYFENDIFAIDIPKVNTSLTMKENNEAFHFIDLQNGSHYGSFPFENGTYYDKNYGIKLKNISGILKVDNSNILIQNIVTNCSDILVSGNVEINFVKDLESIDIRMQLNKIEGDISNLQQVFSSINKSFFLNSFPMRGSFKTLDENSEVEIKIKPDSSHILTKINASLNNGSVNFPHLNLSIKNLDLNFAFNQMQNILQISNVNGILEGKDFLKENYVISGKEILFSDFKNKISNFEIKIDDAQKSFIKLVGNTFCNDFEDENLFFKLDESRSFLGPFLPSNFSLKLKNGTQINDFNVNLCSELKDILIFLKNFEGYFFEETYKYFYENISKIFSTEGFLNIKLKYDHNSSLFFINSFAQDFKINHHKFNSFICDLSLKDNFLSINQCNLDDLSISAEICKKNKFLSFNYFGLKYKDAMLLGGEGSYNIEKNQLNAKINFLEIFIDKLKENSYLSSFITKNKFTGKVQGNGNVSIYQNKKNKEWDYDSVFTLTIDDLNFRNLNFDKLNNFSCHIQKNNGITFRNIITKLLLNENELPINLSIEKANYHFVKNHFSIDSLSLDIFKNDLFFETLILNIPEFNLLKYKDFFISLMKYNSLKPLINFSYNDENLTLKVGLPNGNYRLFGEDYPLSNFLLEMKNNSLTVSTGYRYQLKDLWVSLNCQDINSNSGTLTMTDLPTDYKLGGSSIIMNWELDKQSSLFIKNMYGRLSGISLNLIGIQIPEDQAHNFCQLIGEASFVLPEALPFFDLNLISSLKQNQIYGTFNYKGQFNFSKNKILKNEFHGTLNALNFALKGYHWNDLNVGIDYYTDKITLNKLVLADPSCTFSIPKVLLEEDYLGNWWMDIPQVFLKNFKPSKLREVDSQGVSKFNSLIFNYITLEGIKGNLSKNESWVGTGKLKFSNPPKNSLQNTIFSLPHELITRIGLNPSVLIPVTGQIYFDIINGKIIFTKFKDVYSETKGSKFYLPKTAVPSYLDFDGNLNIYVRMKQYNLLFKIAELMTVSINGTLNKPSYSFNKEKSHTNRKKTLISLFK